MKILKAKSARKIADKYIETDLDKENREIVFGRIKHESSEGGYEAYFSPEYVNQALHDELVHLGYLLSRDDSTRSKPNITVSWRN